ncbi:site-2 protease family protein [Planococcus sp. YIM B11945]|uniref:site-2 protease family protein n=1 Tax=Planococcus sp. YIM B11945 TaxID=3435410 RepID=UPI003D7D589D
MLVEVILVLLIITTALFIHEMGHGVATISSNKKAKAEIYFGSSSRGKKLKLRLGRITCYLTIALSAFCRPSNPEKLPPPTYKQRLIFLIGGPIASLLGFVALYFISYLIPGVVGIIINRVAVISLLIFATSLIPFTYPSFLGGGPTDGLQMLNLIKENRKPGKAVS